MAVLGVGAVGGVVGYSLGWTRGFEVGQDRGAVALYQGMNVQALGSHTEMIPLFRCDSNLLVTLLVIYWPRLEPHI